MKLEEFNVDTLNKCRRSDRGTALERYHQWLKSQRQIDKIISNKQMRRIYEFKNRLRMGQYHKEWEKGRKIIYIFECPLCKKEFESASSRRRYCSRECYKFQYRLKFPLIEKSCLKCKKIFKRKRNDSKYCSRKCLESYRYVSKKEN